MSITSKDTTTRMPPAKSTTESALYSQARRDNEKQARDELLKRVSSNLHTTLLSNRSDLTPSAQVLASALLEIDRTFNLPSPQQRQDYKVSAYSQLRRKNEKEICDKLENLIPQEILSEGFTSQGVLGRTTKILLATTRYLDQLRTNNNSQIPQVNPLAQNTMPRKSKFVDSEKASNSQGRDVATQSPPSSASDTTLIIPTSGVRSSFANAQLDFSVGRVLRSASTVDIADTTNHTQVSNFTQRYPQSGTFSIPPHELRTKSPPIPSAMQKGAEVQAMFRDYNKRPDDDEAPLRPNGTKRKKTIQQVLDEISDDEATEPELCRQLEGVAGRLMRTARGLSTPQYPDVEADMVQGKIVSVGSTRTVVSDSKKELIWVIELLIDAIAVVKHIRGYDKLIEKWNGRRQAWIQEGMLAEDVD